MLKLTAHSITLLAPCYFGVPRVEHGLPMKPTVFNIYPFQKTKKVLYVTEN